jgi:hypothetical protein
MANEKQTYNSQQNKKEEQNVDIKQLLFVLLNH